MYRAFANVFENFRITDASLKGKTNEDEDSKVADTLALKKVPKIDLDDDLDDVRLNLKRVNLKNGDASECTSVITCASNRYRKKTMKNPSYPSAN